VELLLDRGAPIDAPDTEAGATPLHYAASYDRGPTVELLLKRGADAALRNKAGKTALDLARANNAAAALALLAVKSGQ
jgi:hypothetical protein